MNEPMVTNYGRNINFLNKFKELKTNAVFASIHSLLGLIAFIMYSGIEAQSQWIYREGQPVLKYCYFIAIVAGLIISVIYVCLMKKASYRKAYTASVIESGIWFATSVGILMNMKESDADSCAIVFIILFLAAGCAYWLFAINEQKKQKIIVDNLEKAYLDIKKDKVCGMAVNNVEIAGDVEYFELKYEDVRNVIYQDINDGKGYYNLFIDYKGGTYKLNIERSKTAMKTLKMIKYTLEEGKDPFEDVFDEAEANHGSGNNVAVTDTTVKVEKNDEGLVCCPACSRWQSGDNRACYKCGQKFEN